MTRRRRARRPLVCARPIVRNITEHRTLRPEDRDDPQFLSTVLVDGYQPLRLGDAAVVAVSPYPSRPTLVAPPWETDDFMCVQYAIARADERGVDLVWMCDVSWERFPDYTYLLAGRIDQIVVRRMRTAKMLLVLDAPLTPAWGSSDVRFAVPNDQDLWSPWVA